MSFTPPGFEASPLAGLDFEWVATDRDGHVAWLVTFGSAVVPPWVEARVEAFDLVEAAVRALPIRGGCRSVGDPHFDREWFEAARRGMFAYDWDVYRGPYRAVAVPLVPVTLAQLPSPLAELARLTRFADLSFRERPTLDVNDVLDGVPGGES